MIECSWQSQNHQCHQHYIHLNHHCHHDPLLLAGHIWVRAVKSYSSRSLRFHSFSRRRTWLLWWWWWWSLIIMLTIDRNISNIQQLSSMQVIIPEGSPVIVIETIFEVGGLTGGRVTSMMIIMPYSYFLTYCMFLKWLTLFILGWDLYIFQRECYLVENDNKVLINVLNPDL